MAIRIRRVKGATVALCAAETVPEPGDVYLDDGQHYALAAKFAQDWQGQIVDWTYPGIWHAMESQKLRDAKEELDRRQKETPAPDAEGWIKQEGGECPVASDATVVVRLANREWRIDKARRFDWSRVIAYRILPDEQPSEDQ